MATSPLIDAAADLARRVDDLTFGEPVACVYNPLDYAWRPHKAYLDRYGRGRRKVVFVGMNPGPWGMAQTGVPFGEVTLVRDWLKVHEPVGRPAREHPKRPIVGFDCTRSEVSGRRLWGLFAQRFQTPESFFTDHFVANYCPLVFMADSGANLTPDKLPAVQSKPMFEACDDHLATILAAMKPDWLIGVGGFAEAQARRQQERFPTLRVGRILHPSPASPAANRDWAGQATRQLAELGVWI